MFFRVNKYTNGIPSLIMNDKPGWRITFWDFWAAGCASVSLSKFLRNFTHKSSPIYLLTHCTEELCQ